MAEDAYISVSMSEKGMRAAYVIDSAIVERAPKNVRSFLHQRIRWVQGFYQSLYSLLKDWVRGRIGIRQFIGLFIAFFSTVVAVLTAVSHTIFVTYWGARVFGLWPISQTISFLFPSPVFYWSLINLVIGNIYILYLTIYFVNDSRFQDYSSVIMLMPLYWYFIGLVSGAAVVLPRKWRRTRR